MASLPIGEAIDPRGRIVSVDDDALRHILAEHPEMEAHVTQISAVIERPDMIRPDRWPGRERYYGYGKGPSTWMFVVVDFETEPPRVVTAYGRRKGP